MEGSIVSCFRYGCPYCEMFIFFVKFWSLATEKAQRGGNASIRLFSLTIKTHILPFLQALQRMMWRSQSNPLPVTLFSFFSRRHQITSRILYLSSTILFSILILVFTSVVYVNRVLAWMILLAREQIRFPGHVSVQHYLLELVFSQPEKLQC